MKYSFSLKIGDRDNVFDGLYGLFAESRKTKGTFDLDHFLSYYDADQGKQPPFTNGNPFWIDSNGSTDVDSQYQSQSKAFLGLVDPFTAIHVYSALLPIQHLKLSSFVLSLDLDKICSFFKAGPLIPNPLPAFDASKNVDHDYNLDPNAVNRPVEAGKVQIPALNLNDWAWLQPHWVTTTQQTQYNMLGLEPVAAEPTDDETPYSVTEGYLQLKTPFLQ